jgi:hypothetical protein
MADAVLVLALHPLTGALMMARLLIRSLAYDTINHEQFLRHRTLPQR